MIRIIFVSLLLLDIFIVVFFSGKPRTGMEAMGIEFICIFLGILHVVLAIILANLSLVMAGKKFFLWFSILSFFVVFPALGGPLGINTRVVHKYKMTVARITDPGHADLCKALENDLDPKVFKEFLDKDNNVCEPCFFKRDYFKQNNNGYIPLNYILKSGFPSYEDGNKKSRFKASRQKIAMLLEAGADPNQKGVGKHGSHPLRKAIATGDIETIELLLNAGADTEHIRHGKSVIFSVSENRCNESDTKYSAIVNKLATAGANVNFALIPGESPLAHAVHARCLMKVRTLINVGADINIYLGNGESLIRQTVSWREDDLALLKILLDGGANPDMQDQNKYGDTPLIQAATIGNFSAVNALLSAGADPNIANKKGNTPLHRIVSAHSSYDPLSIIHALSEAGADLNLCDNKGRSALGIAKRLKRVEVIQFLQDQIAAKSAFQ